MKGSWKFVLSFTLLLGAAECGTRKTVEEQSPAKKLFDRGTEEFKAQRYAEALSLFETLINAYPDSEYADRAKLALIDCDRIAACAFVHAQVREGYPGGRMTFFPNMPEAKARQKKKALAHPRPQ